MIDDSDISTENEFSTWDDLLSYDKMVAQESRNVNTFETAFFCFTAQ